MAISGAKGRAATIARQNLVKPDVKPTDTNEAKAGAEVKQVDARAVDKMAGAERVAGQTESIETRLLSLLPDIRKNLPELKENASSNLTALRDAMINALALNQGLKGADVTYWVGDIEGRADNDISTLIEAGVLKQDDATGLLDFAKETSRLTFLGDVCDRGPASIRTRAQLVTLKEKYPDRVDIVWGNRDIKSLRLIGELPAMGRLEDKAYVAWLDKKIEGDGGTPSPAARAKLNTIENRVQFWTGYNSAPEALKFHQQELSEIRGKDVPLREAAQDYVNSLMPGGEFYKFLSLGNFGARHGDSVIAWHGGASKTGIGIVPGDTQAYDNANDWFDGWQKLGTRLWGETAAAMEKGEPPPELLLQVADGNWNPEALQVGRDGKGVLFTSKHSVVYGARNHKGDNLRGAEKETADFYKQGGVFTEIVAHSPIGHLATPANTHGFNRIYTDTSFSYDGSEKIVASMGDLTMMMGKSGDGHTILWATQPGVDSPFGQVTEDGYLVRGVTLEGNYNLCRYYDGHKIDERYVSPEELAKLNPAPDETGESDVYTNERQVFYHNLKASGKKVLKTEDAEQLLGGRIPIVVSAASKYGKVPASEDAIKLMWDRMLDGLDPAKHVFLTGGTDPVSSESGDSPPETLLHQVAAARGFRVIGFTLEGANTDEVSKDIEHLVIAGHKGRWDEPLRSAIDFAGRYGGSAIFIGGSSTVDKGIAAAEQGGVNYFVMKSDGDEPRGASDQAARALPDGDPRVFSAADADLATRLRGTEKKATVRDADGVPSFEFADISFTGASQVMPSTDQQKASRFVLPVGELEGKPLVHPKRYPKDMRTQDGKPHPLAGTDLPPELVGEPLEYMGKPILGEDGKPPKGLVFFNYEDGRFQGLETDGKHAVLFNQPSEKQAAQLMAKIDSLGGPDALDRDALRQVLRYAKKIGLDDRYNSRQASTAKRMTPIAGQADADKLYGRYVRVSQPVLAVQVPGPARSSELELGKKGGVFLYLGDDPDTGARDIRHVTPEKFAETYVGIDGTPVSAGQLPSGASWEDE